MDLSSRTTVAVERGDAQRMEQLMRDTGCRSRAELIRLLLAEATAPEALPRLRQVRADLVLRGDL